MIDATSYVVLLLVVLSLPRGEAAADGDSRGSTLRAVFRQLGAVPASRLALVLLVIVGALAAGYLPMMPAITRDLLGLGAEGFGMLQAVAAVGALLAGASLGLRSRGGGEARVLRIAALLLPVALAGLGLAASPLLARRPLHAAGGRRAGRRAAGRGGSGRARRCRWRWGSLRGGAPSLTVADGDTFQQVGRQQGALAADGGEAVSGSRHACQTIPSVGTATGPDPEDEDQQPLLDREASSA